LRVIPVLDLRGGRAVLARGGQREAYAPVRSVLADAEAGAGDAVALARAYRDALGLDDCYVADLDAIGGGLVQSALLRRLASLGSALLVDAGVADPVRAQDVRAAGAAQVVVGLETLPSFEDLAAVTRAVGAEHVVFSLDLRDGVPIVRSGAAHHGTIAELARAAVDAGATGLLILDIGRVGSGRGVDPRLVETLRRAHPTVQLLAGGGVAGAREIERLADLGLDGVLVATALHDGRLRRADLEAVRRGHPSDSR
jgi:phosphoribosylformimino-5-aminoimidazole carboxamide ribotide isomerase